MKKNLKVLSVFFLAILLLFVSFTFLNANSRTVKVLKDVSDVFNVVGNLIVNGDVGIGTTTPSAKLTVAGTIESTTGGFKFPDGTTQTTGGFTGSVFTRWGNATCPSGTTLLYSGFGFNEHYTQGWRWSRSNLYERG